MTKFVISLAAALVIVSGSAIAGHCPKDVRKIDSALSAKPDLPGETISKAKALRDTGEQLHKSGKHGESLKALHEAMELLKIEH